ncbi:MAG: hypothetical protein ACF8OB_16425, partial [Phycisphaeraceae bacterium JB051]
ALRPIQIPDLDNASTQQVVEFLREDYANISAAKQRQFMRELAKWYLSCNYADKQSFEQSWDHSDMPRDIKKRITAHVRISAINQLSENYSNIPESEKKQFLAQVSFMIRMLPSGKKLERVLTDKKQWDRVFDDPEKYWQTKDKYAQQLAHHASAEQRANLAKLCKDLADYNKIR